MPTRIFTRDQLDAMGVPHDLPTDPAHAPEGAAVQLHCEQYASRRWVSAHELVFRAPDDGRAYRVTYEQGLTELQEDTDPWVYDDEIEAVEVEARQVTVTSWVPVEDASHEGPGPMGELTRHKGARAACSYPDCADRDS